MDYSDSMTMTRRAEVQVAERVGVMEEVSALHARVPLQHLAVGRCETVAAVDAWYGEVLCVVPLCARGPVFLYMPLPTVGIGR
jgi:hypothetical protein